jgi:hypothetical protein
MSIWVPILLSALTFSGSAPNNQTATTVFRGRPVLKISEGGVERLPERISADKGVNLECVVSRIGDSYYWASRDNVGLQRSESGAFVTYTALNGAGYIRMINAESKAAASLMSPTEEQFDYVEHAVIGLRSVTYYGVRRTP